MTHRVLTVLVTILLVACSHDFDPNERSDDAWDNDEMGIAEYDGIKLDQGPPPDINKVSGDVLEPKVCPAPTTAPITDCDDIEQWACLTTDEKLKCTDGSSRLACFEKGLPVREIRCTTEGACFCSHGPGSTLTPCHGLPENGRSGCNRAKEAYLHGCCQ